MQLASFRTLSEACPHGCNQIQWKNSFFGLTDGGDLICQSLEGTCEVTGHMASVASKLEAGDAGWLTFSFYPLSISLRREPMPGPLKLRIVLPFSGKHPWKHPHRHAQTCVSIF